MKTYQIYSSIIEGYQAFELAHSCDIHKEYKAYANARFLYYANEIRSAVLVMHGERAHSRYFGEAAYHYMVNGKAEGYNVVGSPNPCPENKQLLIIPDATHCDLYDGGYTELEGKGEPKNLIPWDKLADFFAKNL